MPRPLRLLLIYVCTALALAGALWVPTLAPTYEQRYRPIATEAHLGQMTTTRDFRIRVRRVLLARTLLQRHVDLLSKQPPKTRVLATDAIWVVIVADVGAEREKLEATLLEGGEIHTADGSMYVKDLDLPAKGNSHDLDDAIPLGPTKVQWFYFQIPPDRLTGATFEVTKDTTDVPDDPWEEQEKWFLPAARLDLGFDTPAETRNALRHAADRLPIPEG